MNRENYNWEAFLAPYELAIAGFIVKLESIRKQYILKNMPNPIEIIAGRVKTPESILEKAKRLGIAFENIPHEVTDIAGIRITCKYIQDVYQVFEFLKSRKDIEIFAIKDYIRNPKPSGYRSLHIGSRYYVETIDGQFPINIEFQVRTHAMHLWASIEHSLRYKYFRNIPENIQERLIQASEAASKLDVEMSRIKTLIDETNVEPMREEKYNRDETEIVLNNIRKW